MQVKISIPFDTATALDAIAHEHNCAMEDVIVQILERYTAQWREEHRMSREEFNEQITRLMEENAELLNKLKEYGD